MGHLELLHSFLSVAWVHMLSDLHIELLPQIMPRSRLHLPDLHNKFEKEVDWAAEAL